MPIGAETKRGVPGRKVYENKKLPEKFSGLDIKEKLRSIAMHIRTVDREQRIRRNQTFYLMALYYQGYQNVELNLDSATFDIYEKEDLYVENQFRHNVDAVSNSLSKNEGDIVIRPASSVPQDITKARVAGPILDMQKAEIGYDRILAVKNQYKALFGNAFVFVDFIRDQKYGTIVTPKYDYQEIPDEMGGEPFMSKVPAGFTKVNRGREIAVVCSPLEVSVRADSKGFENVPWLQWVSRQDNDLLNYMYPGLGTEGSSTAVGDDLSQHYLDVLSNLPGNALGDQLAYNRGVAVPKAEYIRTWILPCMFAGDIELLKKFPDGVHVATVNGQLADFYAENLFDRWTHEVLLPVPHSLLGDGLYDALLMQDLINEANSLMLKHVRYSTVGHNIFDKMVIDPKDVKNDPENGWIPGTPSLDKKISDAVFQLHPAQLSGDVAAWIGAKLQSLQDMTSAYDPSIGKGIGANTPYSQSVFLTERAQSRWQGSLAYNRPQVLRFHQQLLKIAQNDWTEPRTSAMMANTGAWSFQQFTQADLVGEIDLSLSNTDMKPKGRAEQIQALTMAQAMLPMLTVMPPKQKLRIEEILGLPPDSNPMNTQISRAYRNIDRITKGEDLSPIPFVDDPQVQAPVFQDFLASEDGDELKSGNEQAFTAVFMFMQHLMIMSLQGMVVPQAGAQQGQPQQGQPQQGNAPKPGEKQPGGQPGQKGGGPQPEAQSPAPAPPISPPAA